MAEITKPDYTTLWSSGGAIVAPSNVKIQTGWTAEVPPFQWENWSQNRQDQAIAHIIQHGISVWDAATEYQANKSYVTGSNGTIYKALTTNTNINPTTDGGTNWTTAVVPAATLTISGIVELATSAEVLSGTDNTRAVTPAGIVGGLLGTSVFSGSGYATLPVVVGGIRQNLIIQWGSTTAITSGGSVTTSYPVVFPNACFRVLTTVGSSVALAQGYTSATSSSPSNSSFVTYHFASAGGTASYHWLAVGW